MEQERKPMNVPSEQVMLSAEFSEALGKWLEIFGAHYQQAITELNVAAYAMGLHDLSVTVLNAACKLALRDCEFIPKVADIRIRAAFSREYDCELHAKIVASEMYEKTMKWLRVTDSNEKMSAEELPPVAEYAVKLSGGRNAMLAGKETDRDWARKHFVENYERMYAHLRSRGITTREGAREALRMIKTGEFDFPALGNPD